MSGTAPVTENPSVEIMMRVTIKRPADLHHRELADGAVEEEVDIPAAPFQRAGGIAGLVSGTAISAIISVLTFLLIDAPKASQVREMDKDKANIEALERALTVETADGRRTSVRLLLATGLLEPDRAALLDSLLSGKDTLPRWWTASGAREQPQSPGRTLPGTTGTDSTRRPNP